MNILCNEYGKELLEMKGLKFHTICKSIQVYPMQMRFIVMVSKIFIMERVGKLIIDLNKFKYT